jgi:GNAT superfamily N-acetyltransferase
MGNIEDELTEQALTAADAEAVFPLSVEAGWNQTVEDWRFMLAHGLGLGMRERSGRWIGSAVALPLGPRLSWLCMVLVAKNRRRLGIGTRLLRRCIDAVRSHGAVAGLDATEPGRPVYLPLGFKDLYPISRWFLDEAARPETPSGEFTVRSLEPRDLPALTAFDEARSGMRRVAVLHYLSAAAPSWAFVAERRGAMIGYALGRPGRIANHIGPVMADDGKTAMALLQRGLAAAGGPAIVDAPDAHRAIGAWLQAQGAVRQRGFMRMALGASGDDLAEPGRIFALAGPEFG